MVHIKDNYSTTSEYNHLLELLETKSEVASFQKLEQRFQEIDKIVEKTEIQMKRESKLV